MLMIMQTIAAVRPDALAECAILPVGVTLTRQPLPLIDPNQQPVPSLPADVYAAGNPPAPFQGAEVSPPAPDVKDSPRRPRLLDDSWREPLARQIAEWLRIFVEDGQVVELRALKVEREGSYPATWSGYFDSRNLESMARAAVDLT